MKIPFSLGLASLLLVSAVFADHRDNDDRHREGPRVILYQHAGFSGGSLVLYPGDVIENMSGATFDNGAKLNDSVSSIRVEGDVEVYAYENSRFRGDALRLTENARDLSGRPVAGSVAVSWNDRISSIKVEWVRGRGRDDRGPDRSRPGDDRPRGDPEKLIKDTFKDLLGREPDPAELREFRGRLLDQGWNERMLRDHLRTADHYREETADRIIYRAFRELFGREPDERALRIYRRNMLERGWSEGDVRDDLRKSPEFRNRANK